MENVVNLFPSENPTALIDRAALTEAVELLARLCSRQHDPLLTHLRFSSEPGGLALLATNLDVQAETSIEADVDARFSAAVPATTLLKLLKKGAATNTVLLELQPDPEESHGERFIPSKCIVQFGDMSFTIDVMPGDDLPEPIRRPSDEPARSFAITSAVLWNAIDGLLNAVSTDRTRPYLGGIYVHNHNGRLRFVATDGHRLYLQDTNVSLGKATVSGIIPLEAARFIAALIDGHASAAPVTVEFSSAIAIVIYRDVAVSLKLIDGTFPDYLRIIPNAAAKTATVSGSDLSAALGALSDCTGAECVTLKFEADALRIRSKGDSGEGTSSIACTFEGETSEISFNARYLRSVIDAACPDGKRMTIMMSGPSSPARFTGSIGGWTGVLMPAVA